MNDRELTWTNITAIASQHDVERSVARPTNSQLDSADSSVWVNYSRGSHHHQPSAVTRYEDAIGSQVWHSTPEPSREQLPRPRRSRSVLRNVTFEEDVRQSRSTPRDNSTQRGEAPVEKQCYYCHKIGHIASSCWRRLGLCLVCGSHEHRIAACPQRRSVLQDRYAPSGGRDDGVMPQSSSLN